MFIFRGLETIWEILKNHQIFSSCFSNSCIFSPEKKLRWYYFNFNPKNLLKSARSKKIFFFLLDTVYSKYDSKNTILKGKNVAFGLGLREAC